MDMISHLNDEIIKYKEKSVVILPIIEEVVKNTEILFTLLEQKIDDDTFNIIKSKLSCYNKAYNNYTHNGWVVFCCEKGKGIIVLSIKHFRENTFNENLYFLLHEYLHIYYGHCAHVKIPLSFGILKTHLGDVLYSEFAGFISNVSNDYLINKHLVQLMPEITKDIYVKLCKGFEDLKNALKNDNGLFDFYIMLRLYTIIKTSTCMIKNNDEHEYFIELLHQIKYNSFYEYLSSNIDCQVLSNKNTLYAVVAQKIIKLLNI